MKLSDKQAAFCALYAEMRGSSAQSSAISDSAKAYTQVFDGGIKAKRPDTTWRRVYPLLENPKITARLAELGVAAEEVSAELSKLARLLLVWSKKPLSEEIKERGIREFGRLKRGII